MLKQHFAHCSKCHGKLFTLKSKDYGVCFGCRNYTRLEMSRLVSWNRFYNDTLNEKPKNRFEIWKKESGLLELKLCKFTFIKTGYMIRPNMKKEQEKIDNVCIMIASKNPHWEEKIIWKKFSKGGGKVTEKYVMEMRKKK
jgi:hypothetical protein